MKEMTLVKRSEIAKRQNIEDNFGKRICKSPSVGSCIKIF